MVLHEHVGTVRFVDPHTVEADQGVRLVADKFILCAGGTHRALPVPGAELVGSHRDAWTLASVPESLLVVGAGATGVQVASVFAEFGSRVVLFEAGPRILGTEDKDVSRIMAASFGPPASRCARTSAGSAGSRRRQPGCVWSSLRTTRSTVSRRAWRSPRSAGWPTPPD